MQEGKRKYCPIHDLAYLIFAKTRYHLTRGKRIPIYNYLFIIGSLEWQAIKKVVNLYFLT